VKRRGRYIFILLFTGALTAFSSVAGADICPHCWTDCGISGHGGPGPEPAANTAVPLEVTKGTISVGHSFLAPPDSQPSGLAWHGGHLWMSSYILEPGIYKLNPNTGETENVFRPDVVWNNRYGGLAPGTTSMFHLQANNGNKISELDYVRFRELRRFPIEDSRWNYSDIAQHNGYLWMIGNEDALDPDSYRLMKISIEDGSVVASFPVPEGTQGNQNYGMTADGSSLWISTGSSLFRISPRNGGVTGTFDFAPGNRAHRRIESLAWDGTRLWGASFHGSIFELIIE